MWVQRLILVGALLASSMAQALDRTAAGQVLEQAKELCQRDAGQLWGVSLCGPVLIVEPATRAVVANQNAAGGALEAVEGVFVGTLPARVNVANTATEWDGTYWTMLLWPLPQDPNELRAMLMHEAWHRIQRDIGIPARSPVADHLASTAGRVALRLEWRALASALQASNVRRRTRAIADAMIFRQWRRQQFEAAAGTENPLELSEGLAQFTGVRLSGRSEAARFVAETLRKQEREPSFVRNFAYFSGPAYGLLLDQLSSDWRRTVNRDSDLGALLAAAAQTRPLDAAMSWRDTAARYGLQEVEREERLLQVERERTAQQWRVKLVQGPRLRLPLEKMSMSFNPSNIFALPPEGTVYPTLRVVDAWGVLEVDGGALIDAQRAAVHVAGPAILTGNRAQGPGWSLELTAGWQIVGANEQQRLERTQ